MAGAKGRVVEIQGGVVDCEFPAGEMPGIFEAIEVPREGSDTLILEVLFLPRQYLPCQYMYT